MTAIDRYELMVSQGALACDLYSMAIELTRIARDFAAGGWTDAARAYLDRALDCERLAARAEASS